MSLWQTIRAQFFYGSRSLPMRVLNYDLRSSLESRELQWPSTSWWWSGVKESGRYQETIRNMRIIQLFFISNILLILVRIIIIIFVISLVVSLRKKKYFLIKLRHIPYCASFSFIIKIKNSFLFSERPHHTTSSEPFRFRVRANNRGRLQEFIQNSTWQWHFHT